MDVLDVLGELSGISIDVLNKWSGPRQTQVNFFKPYNSFSNAAYRAASVVTAPFVLALFSAFFAALTTVSILEAMFSAITFNFRRSNVAAGESFHSFMTCLQVSLVAVASPFMNAADTLGGGVTTLMNRTKETQKDDFNALSFDNP